MIGGRRTDHHFAEGMVVVDDRYQSTVRNRGERGLRGTSLCIGGCYAKRGMVFCVVNIDTLAASAVAVGGAVAPTLTTVELVFIRRKSLGLFAGEYGGCQLSSCREHSLGRGERATIFKPNTKSKESQVQKRHLKT